MADIGLKNAKYNELDYTTNKYKTLTNSTVPTLGKLIDSKADIENNSAEIYADDQLAESDYSFKKGTLSLTLADVDEETRAKLYGSTVANTEITDNVEDVKAEIGYGHIITKIVNRTKKYKVEFLPRVKITKISTDGKTKGESVEFTTTTLEGTILALEKSFNGMTVGDWRKVKVFDALSAAQTYLDGLLTPAT